MNDHANLTDQPDQSVQNSSQVPEDHADVVTSTAEHGKKRVAPWVPFRVLRLSRPSFFMCPIIGSIALRRRRSLAIVPVDTTLRAADENHSHFHAMATVSAIDKGHLGPLVCEGLDLFQRLGQRVAIIGIARQRPYPDHKAAPVGRSHADLGAKLVALVRLALGNAVHRRFMQTVELFPVFRLLSQQPVHQRNHLFQARLQPALRNLVQLPLDVAQHPTSVALEPAQRALRIRLNWRAWA